MRITALLQGRLRLPLPRLNHPLRPLLHHASLPLLLHILLLLAQRQRIRNAQQQDTRRDDPQALAAVVDGGVRRGGEGRCRGGDACAGLGRDYVAEGGDAVEEGFVGVDACCEVVVGDFGVYGEVSAWVVGDECCWLIGRELSRRG